MIPKDQSQSEGVKNAHTEHCCAQHGCKYADEDCPVTTGQQAQSFLCESCDSTNEGKGGGDSNPYRMPLEPIATLIGQALIADGWETDAGGDEHLLDSVRAAVHNALSGLHHYNPPTAPAGDWVPVWRTRYSFGYIGHWYDGTPTLDAYAAAERLGDTIQTAMLRIDTPIAAAPKPEGQP